MSTERGGVIDGVLAPNEAFSVLGNETRMQILRELGEADKALSFTELRERVGIHQGGQFNYHLDKVVGHFVEKTDNGYDLRQPGHRVVQAVLSGAVTQDPVIEPTAVEDSCYHCGAPIMVNFHDEKVGMFCTECSGNFDIPDPVLAELIGSEDVASELGFIGVNRMPPAGINGRSPIAMYRASRAWDHLNALAGTVGICPRCSARLDMSVDICEAHAGSDEICGACGNRQAVLHHTECTNCTYGRRGHFSLHLFGTPAFLDFVTDHGLDPIAPDSPMSFWAHFTPYEEEIISVEPFNARFTFTIGDDSMTLTVDDDLSVIDVDR